MDVDFKEYSSKYGAPEISWNQVTVQFFENVTFTEFFQKIVWEKFSNYHTTVWILKNLYCISVLKYEKFSDQKIFRQINYSVPCLVRKLISQNFRQMRVRVNFPNFHTVLWYCIPSLWKLLLNQNSEKSTFFFLVKFIFQSKHRENPHQNLQTQRKLKKEQTQYSLRHIDL